MLGQPRPSSLLCLAMESLPGSFVEALVAAVQFGDAGEELLTQPAAGCAAEAEGAARDGVVQRRKALQLQLPGGALAPLALQGWVAGCWFSGAWCVPSLQRKGLKEKPRKCLSSPCTQSKIIPPGSGERPGRGALAGGSAHPA